MICQYLAQNETCFCKAPGCEEGRHGSGALRRPSCPALGLMLHLRATGPGLRMIRWRERLHRPAARRRRRNPIRASRWPESCGTIQPCLRANRFTAPLALTKSPAGGIIICRDWSARACLPKVADERSLPARIIIDYFCLFTTRRTRWCAPLTRLRLSRQF